jgi:CRP/FNR family transcriptional regulator, cyclic AMP receptor protein
VTDPVPEEHKSKYLAEIDIYRDLAQEEIDVINERAPMRTYPRGETLYSPSSPVETLFMLKTGKVRIYRVSEDGRQLTTALLGPGTVFGEMVLLGQDMDGRFAEALEDSFMCVMSRADVRTYLMGNPKVAARVAELLGERLIATERRLSDTVFKSVPERIAGSLHTLAGEEYRRGLRGRTLTVAITHEQLAALVGTSRETTTKVLGELAEAGAVKLGRGKITVLKPAALKEAAG